MAKVMPACEIVLVTSGHQALDHRVFYKEAVSLAQRFARVRVVGAHRGNEVRDGVTITALQPYRNRLQRFLVKPLQCFLAARGAGQRVLILHDAELLLWAPLVKLLTGWRMIYDVHEDFPQLVMHRAWIPARLRRLIGHSLGTLEKLLSRACDGVIGVTEVLIAYFRHDHRIAVHNLPGMEFIEQGAAESREPAAREYDLVHLGTLCEERLDFLAGVLDALFARKPGARALVLGLEPDQVQLLRDRFPEERLTAQGKIAYSEVAGLLANCRIGLNIHPVLYPHLRCAIPVKVFEYMASGCNVVTSFLPELHRLLGDDGASQVTTIYTPSEARFAEEVVRLLDDDASLLRHQQALLTLVRTQWNWEHEADNLVKFVQSIAPAVRVVSSEQVANH